MSPELMDGFESKLHSCITTGWKRTGQILVTLASFLGQIRSTNVGKWLVCAISSTEGINGF